MKKYSTITKETSTTICVAYLDKYGIETEEGLNEYKTKSHGIVELIFVDTKSEALELLKGRKSIVDDIGYTPYNPTKSHEAMVSVMNSIPRIDDTIKEIRSNYPTQEEIIEFNRKENSI